jgi:hypothetical protein
MLTKQSTATVSAAQKAAKPVWLVGQKAEELTDLAVKLTMEVDRHCVTTIKDELFKAVIAVQKHLLLANQIKVTSVVLRKEQVYQQNQAIAYLTTAKIVMKVALTRDQVSAKQYEQWLAIYKDLYGLIGGWIRFCNQHNARYIRRDEEELTPFLA